MSERVLRRSDKATLANDKPGLLFTLASAPFNIFFSVLFTFLSFLRPYSPRLIPLLVCTFFIPLIIFLSILAGWIVWLNLSVSWEIPLYLQYGDGVPPYAYVHLPALTIQQKYDISVNLMVPATDANVALGNFMTSLTLTTMSNKTLAHIRRPTITPAPQTTFLFLKQYVVHVKVPLLESFVSPTSGVAASVEIGRHDGWSTLGDGHGREVSITSASLRGLAVPHGIRGLAIRFPLLASLASALGFFLILTMVISFCILPLILPGVTEDQDAEETETKVGIKRSDSSGGQRLAEDRGGRRRRRSRSTQDTRTTKAENSVEIIPAAAESSSTKGLRRRSSKPSMGSSGSEIHL